MLLVVITPTSGVVSKSLWMMGVAVATMPEGIVNGPEIDLPKNSYFNLYSPTIQSARMIPVLVSKGYFSD